MPHNNFVPSDAILWYYHVFKPKEEEKQLLQDNPQDWARLQVWDGEKLVPAMPEGFSGLPSDEQIEMLYTHMQNKRLFFFHLGDMDVQMATQGGKNFAISMDPKEPPPPKSNGGYHVLMHKNAMDQYKTSLELHENYGPGFKAAVEAYFAGRDLERDSKERKAREANYNLVKQRINRNKADRVISKMTAPRPSAPADVFFVDKDYADGATIHYSHFEERLAPNGYDLPQDSKLDERDAATINFAMLGAQSDIQKYYYEKVGGMGPGWAESRSKEGFNMMTTGLFGETRINQPVQNSLGEVMRLGKESIDAYNAGDPQLLGRRLAECVRNIKTAFFGTGQYFFSNETVAASKITERILELFEKKPDIMLATGLRAEELEFMRGYAQMGHLFDKYLESRIQYGTALAMETELSPEEKTEILVDSVIRRMVEKEIAADSRAVEGSDEFKRIQEEAAEKDAAANRRLKEWTQKNIKKSTPKNEADAMIEKQKQLFDVSVHLLINYTQPVEHSIINLLGQPGVMERLRESLKNDPAIRDLANRSPMEFSSDDLKESPELDALVEQVLPTLEPIRNQAQAELEAGRAQRQAELDAARRQYWFDSVKAMLTQGDPKAWIDPGVQGDSDRLMIAQTNGDGTKSLVSVASLLEGGLQALQNPDERTVELLHRQATEGNLYFYAAGKDMPSRLSANGMQAATQQLEPPVLPSLWMRFWNTVTFGLAYAAECNPKPDRDPAAYALIVKARANHAAPARDEAEAAQQEGVANQQEQPQPEQIKRAESKPWKYQAEDTRNMTNEQFFDHVKAIYNRGEDLSVNSVMTGEDCTPEKYYEVMTQLLEAQVAKDIFSRAFLENDDNTRNQMLEAHKKTYTAIVVGLGNYVVDHTSKKDLAEHCSHPKNYSAAYQALCKSSDEILRTGVFGYLRQLNRENATNEQAKQQEQQKNEVTLKNEAPQSQQERNPFAKG